MIKNAILAIVALIAIAASAPADQQNGIEVLGIEVLGIEVLGIEVLGIEVLGIEVLSNGETLVHSQNPDAIAGSSAHALVSFDGYTMVVDTAPVTATGTTTLSFPAGTYGPGAAITYDDPTGELIEYLEVIELD